MSAPNLPIRPAVRALHDALIATRRDLHENPELSWEETRTQAVILDRLHSLGLDDVRAVAKTGATALLRGAGQGRCIAWRADTDALPIPERNDLPFASRRDGVMHACGHDGHVAIALGLAEVLSRERERLHGSVRFIFQPAEEASGGAEACIADGVLAAPLVEQVLGLHLSADIPLGAVNVAPGPFFAQPTHLTITITGRGGHAASPHQAIDAVVVAAHVITALQTVVSRSVAPADAAVLTIGTVKAGFRSNVIAESARLTGTIRTYDERVRDRMLRRTSEVVAGVCAAFNATGDVSYRTGSPPVVNDERVTGMVLGEAAEYFGPDHIYAAASMGADDMSVYLQQRPGCYFWLGARNESAGIAGRHHDPGFVIDEAALPIGVEFASRLLERALA